MRKYALPDTPLGGEVGDVEVVNATPLDVGKVAFNLADVVRRIEHVVNKLGDCFCFIARSRGATAA